MAKVLLIKTEKGLKRENDVITIEDDSHIFDVNELKKFTAVTIPGTKKAVRAMFNVCKPEKKFVKYEDGKYYDIDTAELSMQKVQKIEVWKNGLQWNEMKQRPYKWARWSGTEFVENTTRELINLTTTVIIESGSILNGSG